MYSQPETTPNPGALHTMLCTPLQVPVKYLPPIVAPLQYTRGHGYGKETCFPIPGVGEQWEIAYLQETDAVCLPPIVPCPIAPRLTSTCCPPVLPRCGLSTARIAWLNARHSCVGCGTSEQHPLVSACPTVDLIFHTAQYSHKGMRSGPIVCGVPCCYVTVPDPAHTV